MLLIRLKWEMLGPGLVDVPIGVIQDLKFRSERGEDV